MRTFREETEELIKWLKEAENNARFCNERVICEQVTLLGHNPPIAFLMHYRNCQFLLIEGSLAITPQLNVKLPNYIKRRRFILFCEFVIFLESLLPLEQFKRKVYVLLRRATEPSYKSFFYDSIISFLYSVAHKENAVDVISEFEGELRQHQLPPVETVEKFLYSIALRLLKKGNDSFLKFYDIVGSIDKSYEYVLPILKEKTPRLVESFIRLYEGLKVINPKYNQPEKIKLVHFLKNGICLTVPDEILYEDASEFEYEVVEESVDRIIFLPRDWRGRKRLKEVQIQIGIVLLNKGLLGEEEQNSLVKLVNEALHTHQKKQIDYYVLWQRLLKQKGTVIPEGIIAYLVKKARKAYKLNKGKKGNQSSVAQVTIKNDGQMFDSPEEENLINFSDEEVTVPKKRIYKRKRTPENTPKSEYLEVWEVAEELEKEFPNRYKEKMFYTKWLYRQFNKGTISPVVLQQEIKLKEGVSYITKKYLVESRKLDEIKQVFRNWEEEKIIRGSRAVYVQLYAKTYGTTIREGQKMIKKHGAEEILRRLIKLKGLDEIIKNIGEILEKRKNKSIEDKIIEDLRRIFEKRRSYEDLEEEF